MLILAAILVVSPAARAWERSSPSVPPDSGLYRDLDKLVAWGLIVPPIRGQRPYPRGEFARMTAEAMGSLEKAGEEGTASFEEFFRGRVKAKQIKAVMERLESEFRDELVDMGAVEGEPMAYRFHPVHDFTLFGTYLSSAPVAVPRFNGRGLINALVNPLGDYNLGRQATFGFQAAEEFTGFFEVGRFFSGLVRPRFEQNAYRSGDMSGLATVQNAYGTFRAGNFSMKFGRDSMFWGMGDRDSLLYSTNPRPLDGIWVTNPTPARLPWVFKYLGRWRYTLYGVNMGPEYNVPWAWTMGYKVSLAPAKYVELGFGHAVIIGGEGAPSPSAVDVIGEFFGFRPAGTSAASPNISNHMFSLDLLVRIPELRGFEIYGTMAIEDKWKSVTKTLTQGCSYQGGFYLPALNPSGSLDLRIEYAHTNPLQYRHSRYADGFTINRKLIGTDGGPDADTVHVKLRQTVTRKLILGLALDWDYRRSDTYAELVNPDGTAGPIVKIASGPTDQRFRGVMDADWRMSETLRLQMAAGYERAINEGFRDGNDRNNWLLSAAMTWYFDRYFAKSFN